MCTRVDFNVLTREIKIELSGKLKNAKELRKEALETEKAINKIMKRNRNLTKKE
jgi:hypothetical protein